MRDGGTSKALPVGKLLQKSVQRQESANSWIPYRLHSFSWEGNYLESNSMMTSGWDQSCHNCSVVDTPNVTGSIIGSKNQDWIEADRVEDFDKGVMELMVLRGL